MARIPDSSSSKRSNDSNDNAENSLRRSYSSPRPARSGRSMRPRNSSASLNSSSSRNSAKVGESSNVRSGDRERAANNRPRRSEGSRSNQSNHQGPLKGISGSPGTRLRSSSNVAKSMNRFPSNQNLGSGMLPSFFSGLLKDRIMLKSYFARTIILIPTYNERENISRLILNIIGLYPNVYILVIDDSSPDGTADVVRDLGRRNRRIMLLDKGKKEGIGKAYIRGFLYTIELAKALAIDYVVQMDADFSHDPVYLTPMIKAVRETDWVIGSRYVQGVNVVNWPIKRILLSYCANQYVNAVTGIGIKDATAGFKVFRLSVLRQINLRKVVSNEYVFQIEMNYVLKKLGFKVREIPIIFRDRQEGESKITGNVIREAMFKVLLFPFKNIKNYRRGTSL